MSFLRYFSTTFANIPFPSVPANQACSSQLTGFDASDLWSGSVAIERLESRCMLSGTVRVNVNARGDIAISGDGRDNYVEIAVVTSGGGGSNGVVIRGQDSPDGQATLIKVGRDTFSEYVIEDTIDSLDGKLRINLGSGDDFLRFTNVSINGEVRINSGSGGDSISVMGSDFDGIQKWNTASGNDAIIVNNSIFRDRTDIKTSAGADWIAFIDSTTTGSDLKIDTSGGPDLVSFEASSIDSNVSIKTGSFPDELNLGTGTNFTGSFKVDMSSFADALMVESGVTFGDLANTSITGGRRGPNYENAVILQSGVDVNLLPDLSSFVLRFEGVADVNADFNQRLTNINVNVEFVSSLKTLLYRRGFAFSEMPLDTSTLSQGQMDDIADVILVGLSSDELLERVLFQQIFKSDFA